MAAASLRARPSRTPSTQSKLPAGSSWKPEWTPRDDLKMGEGMRLHFQDVLDLTKATLNIPGLAERLGCCDKKATEFVEGVVAYMHANQNMRTDADVIRRILVLRGAYGDLTEDFMRFEKEAARAQASGPQQASPAWPSSSGSSSMPLATCTPCAGKAEMITNVAGKCSTPGCTLPDFHAGPHSMPVPIVRASPARSPGAMSLSGAQAWKRKGQTVPSPLSASAAASQPSQPSQASQGSACSPAGSAPGSRGKHPLSGKHNLNKMGRVDQQREAKRRREEQRPQPDPSPPAATAAAAAPPPATRERGGGLQQPTPASNPTVGGERLRGTRGAGVGVELISPAVYPSSAASASSGPSAASSKAAAASGASSSSSAAPAGRSREMTRVREMAPPSARLATPAPPSFATASPAMPPPRPTPHAAAAAAVDPALAITPAPPAAAAAAAVNSTATVAGASMSGYSVTTLGSGATSTTYAGRSGGVGASGGPSSGASGSYSYRGSACSSERAAGASGASPFVTAKSQATILAEKTAAAAAAAKGRAAAADALGAPLVAWARDEAFTALNEAAATSTLCVGEVGEVGEVVRLGSARDGGLFPR